MSLRTARDKLFCDALAQQSYFSSQRPREQEQNRLFIVPSSSTLQANKNIWSAMGCSNGCYNRALKYWFWGLGVLCIVFLTRIYRQIKLVKKTRKSRKRSQSKLMISPAKRMIIYCKPPDPIVNAPADWLRSLCYSVDIINVPRLEVITTRSYAKCNTSLNIQTLCWIYNLLNSL